MSPSLYFLLVVTFLVNISNKNLALPNCDQRKCGNMRVPNPFIIGKGCGTNPDIELVCDQLSDPPILRLAQYPETEVLEISISPRYLKVNLNVSVVCQADTGKEEFQSFQSPAYTFSPTKNKFIAIGCDVSASILQPDTHGLIHGCTSYCPDKSSTFRSQCNGIGCCQTSLPEGLTESYTWKINTLSMYGQTSDKSQCNYGVIVAEEFTQFEKLRNLDSKYKTLPAVLDWVVRNITCKEAMKNETSYVCTTGSLCINENKGYACRCYPGTEGNPYQLGGCREIDRCTDPDRTPCVEGATCQKKKDSTHRCRCPPLYFGDGRKLGSGCYFLYHIILIVLVGVIIISIVIYFFISYIIKENKNREMERIRDYNYQRNGGRLLEERLHQAIASCTKFSIEEIRKITDDFSDTRVIGNGGSGTVFKGILADGEDVAVKKSQEVGERHIIDFINEIAILSQIRERNIVRLIGYCFDDQCPILVYEYVSNGPLSKHIHSDELPPLSWIERITIAAEVASALAYLHYGVSATVIHRDIKPENILLTERNNAKLGDFGLSRTIPNGQTHGITAQQCGTTGYVDPNMIDDFREEHDVYGYGMVLVELLTKRLAYTLPLEYRATFAQKHLSDILDTRLSHLRFEPPLHRMVDLAAQCIELLGERPNMKEVAAEMSRIEREMRNVIIKNNEADSLSKTRIEHFS